MSNEHRCSVGVRGWSVIRGYPGICFFTKGVLRMHVWGYLVTLLLFSGLAVACGGAEQTPTPTQTQALPFPTTPISAPTTPISGSTSIPSTDAPTVREPETLTLPSPTTPISAPTTPISDPTSTPSTDAPTVGEPETARSPDNDVDGGDLVAAPGLEVASFYVSLEPVSEVKRRPKPPSVDSRFRGNNEIVSCITHQCIVLKSEIVMTVLA